MALFTGAHDLDHQNIAYEEYLRLQTQHDAIRESLDTIRSSATDSTTTSPSLSPTRCSLSRPFPGAGQSPPTVGHRDNHTFEAALGQSALGDLAAQEQQLLGVNEGIKRALTELLNCDLVRGDKPFRMWVQTRLMEAEKELRSRRKRRHMS